MCETVVRIQIIEASFRWNNLLNFSVRTDMQEAITLLKRKNNNIVGGMMKNKGLIKSMK